MSSVSHSRRADLLVELGAADGGEFEAALARVLKADATALHVERVGLWQLRHDPFRLHLVKNYLQTSDSYESGVELVAEAYPSYFGALDTNPLIVADDAQTDARTREFSETYLKPHGIVSMMDVPVWSGGQLVGVVCHEQVGTPRRWTDDEQSFALSIGATVSAMLELRARREAERRLSELQADVAAARELVEKQAETLAVVTHDLRAPLAAIQTTAAMLELECPPQADTTRIRLGRIHRAVRVMERLISDLLEASTLDAGHTLTRERRVHAIDEIVADAVELVREQALDKRITIELEQRAGDARVVCDGMRIGQVVTNLVGNALKFTPKGGRVRVVSGVTDDGRVRVAVHDEGPGVRPEDRAHVFERYWRGPRGHFGLGLYIAKAIIDEHGGTIGIGGNDHGGAIFAFELARLTS